MKIHLTLSKRIENATTLIPQPPKIYNKIQKKKYKEGALVTFYKYRKELARVELALEKCIKGTKKRKMKTLQQNNQH